MYGVESFGELLACSVPLQLDRCQRFDALLSGMDKYQPLFGGVVL